MTSIPNRRAFLSAMATTAALGMAGPALAQDSNINILIWGTSWNLAFEEISANFTEETGIGVTLTTQTTSGESLAKIQAQRGNPPEVDVWFTTNAVAERAVKDDELFVDLPPEAMTNLEHLLPGSYAPRWAAAYAYPLGIVYRPDLVDAPITSWEDLWDPRFANKLGIPAPSSYQARVILVASLLAGGGEHDIEPGLEKLKELNPNVAFWYTSDAQARKALAEGEIAVLVAPPSGAKTVRDAGVEVAMISPAPAPMMYDVMTILKGGQEDLAAQFVNYVIGDEAQSIIAANVQNMPVNVNAAVPEELQSQYPTADAAVTFDEDLINANFDDWSNRFKLTVSQ